MVVSCNRWLAVRLDLLSSLFVIVVAVSAVLVTGNPGAPVLSLSRKSDSALYLKPETLVSYVIFTQLPFKCSNSPQSLVQLSK